MRSARTGQMRAIRYHRYGSADELVVEDVEIPTPGDREVRIRVHAGVVSATDIGMRRGAPFMGRLLTGLFKPKPSKQVLGIEFAGEVDAVGTAAERFSVGDAVWAARGSDFGAHAEYVCMPEDGALAPKPSNLTFGEAAAVCEGGLTALPFLRDAGRTERGHAVLVNGASGSIGVSAVQLAKHFGATVTGVCSTANQELVRSLGADQVIDYTAEDFTKRPQTYDIIFDAAGRSSFSSCKAVLKTGGVFLAVKPTPAVMARVLWSSRFGHKRVAFVATALRSASDRAADLRVLQNLAEEAAIRPIVDRTYSMNEICEAHRYVEQGRKTGNVVLSIGPSSRSPTQGQ